MLWPEWHFGEEPLLPATAAPARVVCHRREMLVSPVHCVLTRTAQNGPREGHCCPKLACAYRQKAAPLFSWLCQLLSSYYQGLQSGCYPFALTLLSWGRDCLRAFLSRFSSLASASDEGVKAVLVKPGWPYSLPGLTSSCAIALCMVWTVSRDIEKEVQSAQGAQTPDGCPPGQLFGPGPLHSRILQWGHSLLLNCHPMVSRTLNLLTQHFWWPSPQEDTWEFVSACPVSRGSKVSRSTLARHLRSLPVPRRPWSHILIDFVKFYFLSLSGPTYLRLPVLTLMCFTCASFSFSGHCFAVNQLPWL